MSVHLIPSGLRALSQKSGPSAGRKVCNWRQQAKWFRTRACSRADCRWRSPRGEWSLQLQSTAAIQFACYLAARSHGASQSAASYVISYSEGLGCCHLRIHLRRSTCFCYFPFYWPVLPPGIWLNKVQIQTVNKSEWWSFVCMYVCS